ncbi:unnamed protein product [Rhizophagus irregularis]|uniref:Uncharacterized protein n=1 Tax=Rhizophagus irregularis TaxID=588596 RepID=A0A2I1FWA0_9GLOM|nr:hypothetical protein RhiirA4_451668 [Rhizophagus irregularis]CAB4428488.1 unnamed protein product [Rhizophagus irregularis]CAB4428554.1 unnamed protein product [Rhizophagus irregularis]
MFFVNFITELIFTSKEVKNQIFSILSQICHNLQKLIIGSIYEISSLTSLINSQHNLVHFESFYLPEELRFNKCTSSRSIFFLNKKHKEDLFDEEKNDEKGLWFPNLKYLQVDYVDEKKDEFKELSLILSSILIKYFPLII